MRRDVARGRVSALRTSCVISTPLGSGCQGSGAPRSVQDGVPGTSPPPPIACHVTLLGLTSTSAVGWASPAAAAARTPSEPREIAVAPTRAGSTAAWPARRSSAVREPLQRHLRTAVAASSSVIHEAASATRPREASAAASPSWESDPPSEPPKHATAASPSPAAASAGSARWATRPPRCTVSIRTPGPAVCRRTVRVAERPPGAGPHRDLPRLARAATNSEGVGRPRRARRRSASPRSGRRRRGPPSRRRSGWPGPRPRRRRRRRAASPRAPRAADEVGALDLELDGPVGAAHDEVERLVVAAVGGDVDLQPVGRVGRRGALGHGRRLAGGAGVDLRRPRREPRRERPRDRAAQPEQHERRHPVAEDREGVGRIEHGGRPVDDRGDRREQRHQREQPGPQPGHRRGDRAEAVGAGGDGVDRRRRVVQDERAPDGEAREHDGQQPGVAQRLQPALEHVVRDHEREDGEDDEDHERAGVERPAGEVPEAPDQQRQPGDGHGHQHRQLEGDVADEDPVDDPGQEADDEGHARMIGPASLRAESRWPPSPDRTSRRADLGAEHNV